MTGIVAGMRAAAIVERCNLHDELVAAAKAAYQEMIRPGAMQQKQSYVDAVDKLDDVLCKAGVLP